MTSEDKPLKGIECRACPYYDRHRVPPVGASNSKIMLIGDYPSLTVDKAKGPFSDRKGIILNTALQRLRGRYTKAENGQQRWAALNLYKTYTVQCVSDSKPTKIPTTHCNHFLRESLVMCKPKIAIVFGATAFNALGFGKTKFSNVRGTFQDYRVSFANKTEVFKVFVTFSLDAVLAQPGLYDDLVRDLSSAFLYAEERKVIHTTEEELIKNYVLPQTVEEVEEICAYIVNYAHEGKDPEKHLIGCDTETDRLEMYDPDAKIIACSFSWEPGYATAILLDHPQAPWTDEERPRVHAAVRSVWECKKPKALHHEKFDRQGVEGRYQWDMVNVVWDTMCGEHLIEEDKKGQYSLKTLTRTRLPLYAGYDDKVDDIRRQHGGLSRVDELKRMRKATVKYEEALEAYTPLKEAYDRAMVRYQSVVDVWQEKRLAEKALAKQEKRKMNKDAYGKKPPKPRKPKEPSPPVAQPPFDFTLIPIPSLVKYAAIDADVCRRHVLFQNSRLNAEHKHDTEQYAQHHLPPPPPVKRLMREHVIPSSKTLAQMEFTGFPVDLEYLEETDKALAATMEKTQQELYEMADEFVVNNPKDVIAVMFQRGFRAKRGDKKKIVVPINDDLRRTKKGQIKADEKALLYVHKQYGYDFPKTLLTYRKANKARNPFLTNVRIHAQLLDGRMHPSFHIPGTATGRLSSSGENMQNCFSEDTEVLTDAGWIRFDELPRDVCIAQFDATTQEITFVEPLEYIQRPCTPGEMRQLTLEQIDLCLTGDHEQLVLHQRGRYAKVPVDNLRSGSKFVHAGMYRGGVVDVSSAWITLVCAAQADGSWNGYGWDFGFAKKRKIDRLRKALDALNVVYTESPRKRGGVRFYVRKLWAERLHTLLGANKEFGPYLLQWSRLSLDRFLDEIMFWDGSFTRKNCYSSNSVVNADWVQIIALLSNRRARKRGYTAHGHGPNWQIDMPQKRNHSWTNHLVRETIDYSGDVYCVRVPTGNIVVRRNGKAVVTGNCPKKLAGHNIKNIFVSPPGMTLVNTDAKGAEIRLFSAYSNDKLLIKAILDGQDTHSFFTSKVWPDESYENIERAREMVDQWYSNKDQNLEQSFSVSDFKHAEGLVRRRTNCKRVVFGTLYGAMAAKIAETAGIPLEEAQEVLDLMFKMFPSIPAYITETQNEVRIFGSVYTKTGRKRRFPMANVRMFQNRCFRQAVNFKIQATSSDIVMWVLNQIAPIITNDLKGQLHATVHDSVVFSVPDAYLSQIPDMMQRYGTDHVAEQFPWLPVPFIWDIEASRRYGSVSNIHTYLEGKDDAENTSQDDDLIEGAEIREEINAELRV